MTYGAPDTYREIFNQEDSLKSRTVDGSKILDKWTRLRTKSYGFGPDKLPLDGLIWYPEDQGPFPLVLCVHGNHLAQEYSDPGYAYLGELLASRGYIFISIDDNFLNMSFHNSYLFARQLEGDSLARAWIILEYLDLWEDFDEDPASPFYKKSIWKILAYRPFQRWGGCQPGSPP